jgi:glycerol-3-phosphate acyltransferase PlsY
VLRTGRRGLAAATLLLDLVKGAVAVLLAEWLAPGNGPLAAAGAFLGHCYPVWLRFRGGKGVATLMGVVLALHWPAGLVYAAVWLGLLAALRVSSVAGMAAAMSAPVSAALMARFDLVLLFLALALIVLWKHGDNIERLLAGTEPGIGGPRE